MPHVELTVSGPLAPEGIDNHQEPLRSLDRWGAAVHDAVEACLLVDHLSRIVAASPAACQLLGLGEPQMAVGLSLFAGVLRLLDFTAVPALLGDGELEKIPPVLACSSGRLAHALMRVQAGDTVVTVDAVATPLFDGLGGDGRAVGSLTFLASV